jgi:hypothetical protein
MNPSKFLTLLVTLCLAGCGTFEIGIEAPPAAPAGLPAPTASLVPDTATAPLPTGTMPELPPTEVLQSTSAGPQMVKIFLIAIEDHGQAGKQIGCGDSVVPVQVPIPPTQGVLKASLVALLSLKDQYYGESGLYNALYQSNLQVESVVINAGNAEVHLSGTLTMGGECDTPRVQAQLEETILQFSTVTSVTIYINDRLLSDVLSLKG